MADKTTPNPAPPPKAEGHDRLGRFFEQMAEIDSKNREAAYEAIEEYSKLMKSSVDYAARLGDEWRRIALESSRRAADMMTAWV